MKSRLRKHLKSVERKSPLIGFSTEDLFLKDSILTKDALSQLNKYVGLEYDLDIESTNYKDAKREMYSNLVQFTDNYLVCGGHKYIYLLLPLSRDEGTYVLLEKEDIVEWSKSYWSKEDPNNKRDWSYVDEDVNDLFDYILEKFDVHLKLKF
jgi:hypothetical protein